MPRAGQAGQLLRAAGPLLAAPKASGQSRARTAPMAMTTAESIGTELQTLRQLADDLARRRREPLGSIHLLGALLSHPSPTAQLLSERRLTLESLFQGAPAGQDPRTGAAERSLVRASEVAARMSAKQAGAVHVLLALLAEPATAARSALERSSIDVARLRGTAWNLGLGLVGERRRPVAPATREAQTPAVTARPLPRGIAIPIVPPSRGFRPAVSLKNPEAVPVMLPQPKGSRPSRPAPASEAAVAPVAGKAVAAATPPAHQTAASEDLAHHARNPLRRGRKAPPVGRFELDPKQFPALCAVGINLTALAARGELDPVVGREREVESVLDVLAKRHGNNPCLVGAPGVGKTSVARALALHIVAGGPELDARTVIEISIPELIAGTGVRGALAQRLGALHREVKSAEGRVVVFFDEVHQLFLGDVADEAAGELKLALARGELPCIGATTHEEYRRAIESDPALARRFSRIDVDEPSREDAFLILEKVAEKLREHHGVEFSEEALALAVGWSVRYLPERMLPDKAIALIDLAGARARRRGLRQVTPEEVAEVVAEQANMPKERLLETDAERMLGLEALVAQRVVGHGEVVQKICRILRRNAAGLGARRPIGTFLLLGPTGVGKTETAKAIAQALFHSEASMTRLDMAEYSEPHAVARLIGAPPGYVGHDAGGQLTEAARRRPYQVILLDEIEKAHPEVLQSFLGLFDEGRLTDGKGRTIDFTNTVLFLTSNLGAEHTTARPKRRLGFGNDAGPATVDVETAVIGAARARLSPELYNRLDEVLVFGALQRDEIREIARRLLGQLTGKLGQRGVAVQFNDDVLDALLDAGGFDLSLGARPMKRVLARLVEAPVAELILSGRLPAGSRLSMTQVNGTLSFDCA